VVVYGVLEDALEQQGKFLGGFFAVTFHQPEHGVLHDVQAE
jgi:hypothetical protein